MPRLAYAAIVAVLVAAMPSLISIKTVVIFIALQLAVLVTLLVAIPLYLLLSRHYSVTPGRAAIAGFIIALLVPLVREQIIYEYTFDDLLYRIANNLILLAASALPGALAGMAFGHIMAREQEPDIHSPAFLVLLALYGIIMSVGFVVAALAGDPVFEWYWNFELD